MVSDVPPAAPWILIETNYGDWTEAFVNGKKVYEGHDSPNNLLRNVVRAITAKGELQIVEKEFET